MWVVDGLKHKKDKSQLDQFLNYAAPIKKDSSILKLHSFLDDCIILEEWSNCGGAVFFDFGIETSMWCLLPKSSKGNYYMFEYSKKSFIEILMGNLNGNSFSDLITFLRMSIFAYENPEMINSIQQSASAPMQQQQLQRQFVVRPSIRSNDLCF